MFGKQFGGWEHRTRMFEKGDLKYVILDLLKDKPSHGYEIIRALEERFHGFYSPSAGSVYPTLQLLEDLGYVRSIEQDGKKVYTITEEGTKFLKEREETIGRIKEQMKEFWTSGNREDFREAFREFRELAHLLRHSFYRLDKEKLTKIKDILVRAHRDIEAVLGQEKDGAEQSQS